MRRHPCCPKEITKGAWSREEDETLSKYIAIHGEGKWQKVALNAGLKRCGKSCRQRWLNYLKPGVKRGNISSDEEDMIIRLHRLLGNRWALIAKRLPGRTDNEIKNYWNTNLIKKLQNHHTTTSSLSLLSTSHTHNHQCEVEKTEQINNVKNNGIHNSPSSSNKREQGSSDKASITDFLIDIDDQNKELKANDDVNSKIPNIENQNIIVAGSTNSPTPTTLLSPSNSHQCHLMTMKFDPLGTFLNMELEKMDSFHSMENE